MSKLQSRIHEAFPEFFSRKASMSERKTLVMDEEWWKLNIALALSPSIICEYNRTEAEEYQREQLPLYNKS